MRRMRFHLLAPAVLASLLLGAHLLRAGWLLPAVAVALAPLALVGGRKIAARLLQGVLALGALEGLRTLVVLAAARREAGLPHLRLIAILGAVALITALAVPLVERWRRGAAREARA